VSVPAFAHEISKKDGEGRIDLTHLPLGDGMLSSEPAKGKLWPCRIDPGAGGAMKDGPWFNKDGKTYDLTAKIRVSGENAWDAVFAMKVEDGKRLFTTNDLPSHPTGTFPIGREEEAYKYDPNPHRIKAQEFAFQLPLDPILASEPSCVPGAIGVLTTGSALFNALDAPGRDAVAHETQDLCQGHPQPAGVYHYHNVSVCVADNRAETGGHSDLVGYLIDGFGIYGRYGEGGKLLTSADLDECHGHAHDILWNGKTASMYHYHATWDFPYTAGCMKGGVSMKAMKILSGPRPGWFGGP
jgi:YHYH protein